MDAPQTFYRFTDPFPVGRFFWRVRYRVNSVWSLWSIRYTFFIDAPAAQIFEELTSVPITASSVGGEGLTSDAYQLTFSGDQLGIVFDTDPNFKEMTIEIDGEMFSTIYPDQPAAEGLIELYTLPDGGSHTVRVYGRDGAEALQAFLVKE